MAAREARSAQSYENEQLLLAMLPQLLSAHGFSAVITSRHGQMKFVDTRAADGAPVKFWLKQGWTNARTCAAIQFGMFEPMPDGRPGGRPDSVFLEHVEARVASAKAQGVQYLLMVHMPDGVIRSNYVAMEIDDAVLAFRRQLVGWPKRARNSNSPTLYFDDERDLADAECVSVVKELAVPLSAISGLTPAKKGYEPRFQDYMGRGRAPHETTGFPVEGWGAVRLDVCCLRQPSARSPRRCPPSGQALAHRQ